MTRCIYYLQCEDCGIQIKIKDDDLLAAVDQQMETHTPSKPSALAHEPSGNVIYLTNAINRGLEKPGQPAEIMKLILQGVSARYTCFAQEVDPIDIHGEGAIQYITISADNAVTVAFKG